MGKTKIQWTDATWNPVVGCTKVSKGCQNCYAEKMAGRLANMGQSKYTNVVKANTKPDSPLWRGEWNHAVAFNDKWLDIPLHWQKPRRIFVCSMGDLFHESVPFEFIGQVILKANLCEQHTFQILTKRIERCAEFCQPNVLPVWIGMNTLPKNIWLGVTIELPKYKYRAEILSSIPAAVRFISFEPLLGDIGEILLTSCREDDTDLDEFGTHIDWGIIGCESGPKRRLGDFRDEAEWHRAAINIASQFRVAGLPVFVKQIPINGKVSKDMSEWPEDLRIREYPE